MTRFEVVPKCWSRNSSACDDSAVGSVFPPVPSLSDTEPPSTMLMPNKTRTAASTTLGRRTVYAANRLNTSVAFPGVLGGRVDLRGQFLGSPASHSRTRQRLFSTSGASTKLRRLCSVTWLSAKKTSPGPRVNSAWLAGSLRIPSRASSASRWRWLSGRPAAVVAQLDE